MSLNAITDEKREYAMDLVANMTVDQLLHQYAIIWKRWDDKMSPKDGAFLEIIRDEMKSRTAA